MTAAPEEARCAGGVAPLKRNLLTPKLVAIVLGLDAFVVIFPTLAAFGLKRLEPALAFGGGAAFFVICVLLAGLARKHAWVVWAGWLVQAALVAMGALLLPMYIVGGLSLILWVWCLWRGSKADRAPFPDQAPGAAP